MHLLKILGKRLDNKDYCDSELFNQSLYFCAAYCALTVPPKLALYLFSQNLPSLNLQYSKFSKKPTSSQHMYPIGTYFSLCCCHDVMWLCGIFVIWSDLHDLVSSLSSQPHLQYQAQVPSLAHYNKLVRPGFRWVPVNSS